MFLALSHEECILFGVMAPPTQMPAEKRSVPQGNSSSGAPLRTPSGPAGKGIPDHPEVSRTR